jgi:hypothetical protein
MSRVKTKLPQATVKINANQGPPLLHLLANVGTSRIPTAFDSEFDVLFVMTTLTTENDNEVDCKVNKYVREDVYPEHIRVEIFKWRYPQHTHVTTWNECVELYKSMSTSV